VVALSGKYTITPDRRHPRHMSASYDDGLIGESSFVK
jgi:hypothetical protein